jgi:hypothetical protein
MGQIDLFGGADTAAECCRHHLATTAHAAAGPPKPTLSALCTDAQLNGHPGLNPKSARNDEAAEAEHPHHLDRSSDLNHSSIAHTVQ